MRNYSAILIALTSFVMLVIVRIYYLIIKDIWGFGVYEWTQPNNYVLHNQTKYVIQYETHCQYLELTNLAFLYLLYLPLLFALLYPSFQYTMNQSSIPRKFNIVIQITFAALHILGPVLIRSLIHAKDSRAWGSDFTTGFIQYTPIAFLISLLLLGMLLPNLTVMKADESKIYHYYGGSDIMILRLLFAFLYYITTLISRDIGGCI